MEGACGAVLVSPYDVMFDWRYEYDVNQCYVYWYERGEYADDDPEYKALLDKYAKDIEEYGKFINEQYELLREFRQE